jgi:transposase
MGVCRPRAEGEKPMTSEPAAQSQPTSVRARRRARIAARIAERENYFDLLASGYSCPQIADAAKVSVATVQRAIDRAIAERRLDAPDRYMHLQVARLTKALRLADASIERGDLKAVAPLTRLVAALDRYHGLAAAKPHWRPAPAAPLPAPAAPPLALPAPPVALTDAKTGVDEPLRD